MNINAHRFWTAVTVALVVAAAGCGKNEAVKNRPGKASRHAPVAKVAAKKPAGREPAPASAEKAPVAASQPLGSLQEWANPSSDSLKSPAPQSRLPGQPSAAPPTATTKETVQPIVPPKPTAQQLFSAVQSFYGSAQSLRVQGVSSLMVKQDGKVVAQERTSKFTTIFKRPDKFATISPQSQVYSNGKAMYEYAVKEKRYAKMPVNEKAVWSIINARVGVGVLGLLFRVNYAPAISSYSLLKDEKIDGKDAFVLLLKLKKGTGCPTDADANQLLWIGKKDLAIYKNEVTVKLKAPKGYKGKMPKLVEQKITGTMTKFEPNVKLADTAFTFRPPAGAKLIEPPKKVVLNGKPAPDFSFTWTDSTVKKLSDFRGKPVLLVFWALPMNEADLPVLQSARDAHKDDVVLIAVCLNTEKDNIRKYMKEKGLSFPIVFADEKVGEVAGKEYGVLALPTTFLVDRGGIVRDTIAGPLKKDDLPAKLEKIIRE